MLFALSLAGDMEKQARPSLSSLAPPQAEIKSPFWVSIAYQKTGMRTGPDLFNRRKFAPFRCMWGVRAAAVAGTALRSSSCQRRAMVILSHICELSSPEFLRRLHVSSFSAARTRRVTDYTPLSTAALYQIAMPPPARGHLERRHLLGREDSRTSAVSASLAPAILLLRCRGGPSRWLRWP